jgi:hypothetical protein
MFCSPKHRILIPRAFFDCFRDINTFHGTEQSILRTNTLSVKGLTDMFAGQSIFEWPLGVSKIMLSPREIHDRRAAGALGQANRLQGRLCRGRGASEPHIGCTGLEI